ncbi:hypothetical protein A2467_01930 [Candidatus Nomurabacteria bacterium RIFOXYC2_FULL_36_8]|nr:MAG: hypothetical protein UR97_C0002G0062 [Candidatus Nomurabacteria bacterium GW2011_GWE2_36_115]KKP94467.1 MAG: hypothetical protein US00_C0001G0061 [Candidatus Nomurabacteria bacterium GW2011_GWF2_36_126]KKP96929.1 MAG: hypothetical protein US04_C0001G0432 [Candidatus Nomurabacteria bacterium GW2011_GWD2_36_14]KKP99467.1 MAG: hypothetical protein US08_C0001G0149 [Candidatus Nomurabacteria bacterium GW2011_GWF2_36_19]KKQ05677.1 MAG: hypothetical protein US17_C0002G0061 [Candidatus Nomuraba
MPSPFELIKDSTLQFIFLFSNADGFYISARRALAYGWIPVGCSNAHQSMELYIKAILKLNHEQEKGHDLVKLLEKYKNRDSYFSSILDDIHKVDFLNQLSEGYLTHRYGEAGSKSNSQEIITILDELTFNLRNLYLRNIKSPSNKIYIPFKLQEEFLLNNQNFTVKDLTKNPMAQMGLPIDMELPEDF